MSIQTVADGGTPPMVLDAETAGALRGPDTIDCVAPAQGWQNFWQQAAAAKRDHAPWLQPQVQTASP